MSLKASFNSHMTCVLLVLTPPPAQSFHFCLVQVKPEIPYETNRIQNSSTPRIMGWFGELFSQVWTPTQISMKIWLFLSLHSLGLPCYILNPEGIQNLLTSLSNLSAREDEDPRGSLRMGSSGPRGGYKNMGTSQRRTQARLVPVSRAQCIECHIRQLELQKIIGRWEKTRRKIRVHEQT